MPYATSGSLRPQPLAPASCAISEHEMRALGLLKGVDIGSIKSFLQACPVRMLKPGEIVVRAGDSCPVLYLVLSGQLRVQDPSASVPDSTISPGDCLGEMFLLQNTIVAWTISAVQPTRLLVVDVNTAWRLVDVSHVIARNMIGVLAERLRGGVMGGAPAELRAAQCRYAALDHGTGLHNRAWLESVLPRQVARSAMSNMSLSLLLLEIDRFADYKAQFGADAAERARYAVAQTLINNVRPTDLVACYGPASFAIVLADADVRGARVASERVREAVAEAVILTSDESTLPSITVSIGAASLQFDAGPAELLRTADVALQEALGAGGNRCTIRP